MIRDGLHWSLVGTGHRSFKDLNPDDLIAPHGFFFDADTKSSFDGTDLLLPWHTPSAAASA
jgi:hypothetical protein